MYEMPVLVYTKAAGLVEVARRENVAKNPAYMTAKGIKDVYVGLPI